MFKLMIEPSFGFDFLILQARLAFVGLDQRFFRAPIIYYINFKCYIYFEINISDYAIGKVFS